LSMERTRELDNIVHSEEKELMEEKYLVNKVTDLKSEVRLDL